MTRKECLDKAAGCVLKDRQNQYGGPENNFERIAQMWNGYLGTNSIKPWDVAAMMGMLKMARARFNPKYADNWVDMAGYAACGIECATAQEEFDKALDEFQKKSMERMFKKAECCEEQTFQVGEHVQYRIAELSEGARWLDAWYLERLPNGSGHIVKSKSEGRIAVDPDKIRKAPKAEGCEEPEFKYGDRVQFRDEIPSTSEPHWFEGVYVERLSDGGHAVKFGPHGHVIHCSDKEIRPAPKAEGCEELVERDAPQTPAELYDKIIASNPATFGRPRTLTGEELAEMAEEDEEHE